MSDPITGDAQLDAFIREEEARRYPQLVAPSQERGQEQEPDPDEPLPQLRSPEQDRPRGLMETALRRGLRRWPRD